MSDTSEITSRYGTGDMRERLYAALRMAGKEPEVLKHTDLGEADHFHTGGAAGHRIRGPCRGHRPGDPGA